jgi:hypothetical protein
MKSRDLCTILAKANEVGTQSPRRYHTTATNTASTAANATAAAATSADAPSAAKPTPSNALIENHTPMNDEVCNFKMAHFHCQLALGHTGSHQGRPRPANGFTAFDLWRERHYPELVRAVNAGEIGWGDAVEEAFYAGWKARTNDSLTN